MKLSGDVWMINGLTGIFRMTFGFVWGATVQAKAAIIYLLNLDKANWATLALPRGICGGKGPPSN